MAKQFKQIKIDSSNINSYFDRDEQQYSNNLIEREVVESIGIYGMPGVKIKFNLLSTYNKDFVLNNTGIFTLDTSDMPLTGLSFERDSMKDATHPLIMDFVYTSLEGGNN